MKEPTRLRGDPKASGELRALMGKTPLSRPMTREMRARSAARVDRLAVLPAAAGLLVWLKGAALAASVGAIGVVGVVAVTHLAHHDERAPSAPSVTSTSTRIAVRGPSIPPPPPVVIPPQPVVMPDPSVATAKPATLPPNPPAATQPSGDPLAREAAMLEEARALLDHAPVDALARLDAHAATFPAGVLAPERELMAVDALRRLGRVDEAKRRGERLLGQGRGSLYEQRVRSLLDGMNPKAP